MKLLLPQGAEYAEEISALPAPFERTFADSEKRLTVGAATRTLAPVYLPRRPPGFAIS